MWFSSQYRLSVAYIKLEIDIKNEMIRFILQNILSHQIVTANKIFERVGYDIYFNSKIWKMIFPWGNMCFVHMYE